MAAPLQRTVPLLPDLPEQPRSTAWQDWVHLRCAMGVPSRCRAVVGGCRSRAAGGVQQWGGRGSRGQGGVVRAGDGETRGDGADSRGGERPDSAVQDRLALLELYTSWSDDEAETSPSTPGPAAKPTQEGPSSAGQASLTSASQQDGSAADTATATMTVADKLASQVKVVVQGEVVVPIAVGRKLVRKGVKPVTEAQQRNLRRAVYLDSVGQRNDSTFFFVVLSSVLLPPVVILGVAYASGYLEFLS